MTSEIFRNHQIEQNKTSELIPMQIENLGAKGEYLTANSLSIFWNSVVFDQSDKPFITIECTEDGRNFSFMKSISIHSNSNSDDITTLIITQLFKYLRIKFNTGSAESGTFCININYR